MRALPFGDRCRVGERCVEHVGGRDDQLRLVEECCRVADTIVIATPNRWLPIEAHTLLPLVHWLPERWYRPLLTRFAYGRVGDLRLLDAKSLRRLAPPSHDARVVRRLPIVLLVARVNSRRGAPPPDRS